MGKAFIVVGIVLALLGIGYLLMPQMLPPLGSGMLQQAAGIVLVIAGALVLLKKR